MSSDGLPALDAHAHLSPTWGTEALECAGPVLSMGLSLDEAAHNMRRTQPAANIVVVLNRVEELISRLSTK